MRIASAVIVVVFVALALSLLGAGRPSAPPAAASIVLDTGAHANATVTAAVVAGDLVAVPGASALRLSFDDASLPAGSFVRLTSLLDQEVQDLDIDTLALWGWSSAYFNGDTVRVELVAAPGTDGNRVVVGAVEAEGLGGGGIAGDPGECGICGSDDRVPSSEGWVGRLRWGGDGNGCTIAIFNVDSCFVTAGHCLEPAASQLIEFNVPDSNANCTINHPPIADQFPVIFEDWQANGIGADWGVGIAGPNSEGQRPYDRYGVFRPISDTPAVQFQAAELTGYGADTTCERNRTQQVDSGQISGVLPTYYRYSIDMALYSSGSPLVVDGNIVAVNTACPCPNFGTRVDLPAFANSRYANCPSCGDPGNGDCFTANGTPFCAGLDCCLTVCAVDADCCDVAWDTACVALATDLCAGTIANDDCADALPIGEGDTAFSTIGATSGPPELAPGIYADAWYVHDPTCPGTLTVSTCDQADFDTVLAAYTGDCENLVLLASNFDDAGCGDGTSSMDVPITCGEPVFIRVGGATASSNGTGTLSLTCRTADLCPPDNNTCANAAPIDDNGAMFDSTFATTDGPNTAACVFGQIHSDLWYAYESPCQGTAVVNLCGSDFNTRLAIYEGTCPAAPGEAIACDDNAGCDDTSVVVFPATAGTMYLVRVGGISGATGNGVISIQNTGCAAPPPNDNCGAAVPATPGSVIPFTTIGATTDGPVESCADPIQFDVWYRLIPGTCPDPITLSVCNADFDTRIAVYGSLCPGGPDTAIACNDDGCGYRSHLVFTPTGGTYRVRIGGAEGQTGSGDFEITCGIVDPPCTGDSNGDGAVDVDDLNNVILDWGTDGSANGGDITGPVPGSPPDGIVDVNDLNVVFVAWGACG